MVSGDSKRDRLRSVLRTTELGTAVSAARSLLDGLGASRQPPRAVRAGRNGDLRGDLLVERASGSGRGGIRQNPRTGTKTPELGRKEADAQIGRRHAVALADLDPGSTYYYCVEGVGRATASGFRSAPWARTPAFPSPWSATAAAGISLYSPKCVE